MAQASKNSDSNAQHFLSDLRTHSWFHSMLFTLLGHQFPYTVMNRCFYLSGAEPSQGWGIMWLIRLPIWLFLLMLVLASINDQICWNRHTYHEHAFQMLQLETHLCKIWTSVWAEIPTHLDHSRQHLGTNCASRIGCEPLITLRRHFPEKCTQMGHLP
jgi:hypothetical protein